MRLEIAMLSPAHSCPARSHVRDAVSGRPRKLQHEDAPINSVWQMTLMAGRNSILEKNPTQSRVVAVKRGFRVLRAHFAVHANFVLRSDLVWTKDR